LSAVEELNAHYLTPSLSVTHFMELSTSFSTAVDDRVKMDQKKRDSFSPSNPMEGNCGITQPCQNSERKCPGLGQHRKNIPCRGFSIP
jgi:hypothetical protein